MTLTVSHPRSLHDQPSLDWHDDLLPPLAGRIRARLRIGEVGLLTLASLGFYIWVAWWMRDSLHFFVNDALDRTSDAVFITVGRDPHLGAIGFGWPPLPQLLQAPFVPFLAPYGRADMAGPLSSAVCMALTILVIGRLCKRLDVSRWMRFLICLLFASNPVTIYYASNGMSEACSFLFIAVAMLGFLTFVSTRSTTDLMIMSIGLSGEVLTRLEAPLLSIVLAGIAAMEWHRWRRSLWTFSLILMPPTVCFAFWLAAQAVLLGNPFFFLAGGLKAPSKGVWIPDTAAHPWLAFPWALHWSLVLGPCLALAVLFVIWSPHSPKARGTLGIIGGASVFVTIQIDQLITHTGYGDPRYFVTALLFAAIAAAWMASVSPQLVFQLWNVALLGLLLLGGVTGSRSLSNGRVTHVEGECRFFTYGPGEVLSVLRQTYPTDSLDYCPRPVDQLSAWQHLDSDLDRMLKPHDRVLVDNYSNFYANIFTTKADQFVVRNDRDWDKIVANPTSYVDYIVTAGNVESGGVNVLPDAGEDEGQAIIDLDPSEWKLVASFSGGADYALTNSTPEIFKYVPSADPTQQG